MADMGAASRVAAMDGLRGWAALSVVVFHFTWELFGGTYPEFRTFVPAMLGSGRLAVAIFFTLSGYVLTIRRWRRDDNPPYYGVALKRYVRLTIPIFVISMLFYLAMVAGFTPTHEASQIIHNRYWMGNIANFEPEFLPAVFFGLVGAYGFELRHLYHPFLWTMIVELWGSYIVFGISQNGRFLREPYSALLLFAVFFLWLFPLIACFFLGALVALLQRDGVLFRNPPGRLESAIATLLFAAGVIGAAFMHVRSENLSGLTVHQLVPASLTGVVVVFAAARSRPVSTFLSRPLSQGLGKLSFPLYLAHGVVAAAVSAPLIVWTASFGPIDTFDALLISLASILSSLALAQLLLPVETFTLSLLKRIPWPRARPVPAVTD